MNSKLLIGVVALVVVLGGWYLYQGSTINYVATIDDEVTQLEAELAALEAAVEAGEISPEEAAEAQIKISARLESIDDSIAKSEKAKLTPAQRSQLMAGLDRLKQVLTDYRATLVAVDEAVLTLPESQRPQLNRGGGGKKQNSVVAAIEDIIDVVEDYVEEVVEDYVPDGESDDMEMTDEDTSDSSMGYPAGDDDSVDEMIVVDDDSEMSDESTETGTETESEVGSETEETDGDLSVEAEGGLMIEGSSDSETSTEEEETTN